MAEQVTGAALMSDFWWWLLLELSSNSDLLLCNFIEQNLFTSIASLSLEENLSPFAGALKPKSN